MPPLDLGNKKIMPAIRKSAGMIYPHDFLLGTFMIFMDLFYHDKDYTESSLFQDIIRNEIVRFKTDQRLPHS